MRQVVVRKRRNYFSMFVYVCPRFFVCTPSYVRTKFIRGTLLGYCTVTVGPPSLPMYSTVVSALRLSRTQQHTTNSQKNNFKYRTLQEKEVYNPVN
jgi:hypothetical protein